MQEDVLQETPPVAEARYLDGTLVDPAHPVGGDEPIVTAAPAVEMLTNATCWLQPNPRYGDGDPLVEIPQSSTVSVGTDVQADDHGRPWQQVSFDGLSGWVQVQNLRGV